MNLDPDVVQRTVKLVTLAQGGDREAYEQLFAEVADRVELYIRLRLGQALRSKVETADVLQEAYLEAFRDLARFEPREGGGFHAWVCRIAEHRIRGMADHFAAKKRQAPAEPREVSQALDRARASGHGPATSLIRREGRSRLEQALETLEEEERNLLLLRYFEDQTIDGIAQALGRSASAVRRLLGRAHLHLSEALGHAGTAG